MNFDALIATLKVDEGLRLTPYLDTATPPRVTIGYGINISDGITMQEAHDLLVGRAIRAQQAAAALVANWDDLGDVRQGILANMAYNLGGGGLGKFKNMIAAIVAGDFPTAANAMLASRWASQVGARAVRLATEMRTGIAL